MQDQNTGMSCTNKSWALAAGAGFLLFLLLMVGAGWGFFSSFILGLLACAVLGFVFKKHLCSDQSDAYGGGSAVAGGASGVSTPVASAPTPSAPEANEAEVAVADAPEVAPSVEVEETAADAGADDASVDDGDASEDVSVIKQSAALAGEAELADRKGTWKYEGEAAEAEASAPAATAEDVTPDYDGDGILEGADEGAKPQTLSEAREGGADNLKEIKGVGPKLEQLLNSMGFYHFDQIANLSDDEVAWVNANLAGFKGRVSRDNWVEQSKILAAGGDTEFSKRVGKGDVY